MTPTQRALAHCRQSEWLTAVVEHWNPHAHIRQDLFGIIDLLVLDGKGGPLGVQVTTGANVSVRLDKALAEPRLKVWLASGCRFEVWGYRKLSALRKDGSRSTRKVWRLRTIPITLNQEGNLEVGGER